MEKSKKGGLKLYIYNLLDVNSHHVGSRLVNGVIIVLILLNALSLLLGSIDEVRDTYGHYLKQFDHYSVLFFSAEYLLRMWTITCNPLYQGGIKGRIRFGLTGMQIIDLFAVMPYFLSFVHVDLRVLRLLRVFRLLRIFKVTRYVSALSIVVTVLNRKRAELMITAVMLFFLLLIASTLMYYTEGNVQPESFSSIPETMWWSVITLSTVGYGDVYPITTLGRIIGGMIAVLGISFFAIPTGILTSGFNEVLQEHKSGKLKQKADDTCPTCGKKKS